MSPLEKIAEEFRELGYLAEIVSNDGKFIGQGAVVFDYAVSNGRYKGRTFKVGIGFQEDAYPEYPPHFIYVADLPSPQLLVHNSFHYNNVNWLGFSVPPSDFWDSLPLQDKNMRTYLYRHLTRFWSQV